MTMDGDTSQTLITPATMASALEASRSGARRRPATIALFGLFGVGNLGNDGSLEAMVRFLRDARPDAELFCVCDDPRVVAGSIDVDFIPLRRSRQLLRWSGGGSRMLKLPLRLMDQAAAFWRLRRADLMIIPGTGILDDFGERPHGMPLDIAVWCLAARLMGAKVAFVCIGAGPIRNSVSRRLMTFAARLANYRSYRDQISSEFMKNVGVDADGDPVYPDIAFKLAVPEAPERPSAGGKLTVGVGVMGYRGWYSFAEGAEEIWSRYLGKLSRFVVHLLEAGHDIRLLIGEAGDMASVDALQEMVTAAAPDMVEGRVTAVPSASLHELMQQMAHTDAVVATRFHNVVCALKMGRPTISIGYAKKNDVLMADMGLGGFCQHVEDFDLETLKGQFDLLVENRETYSRKIRDRVRDYEHQLARQDEHLIATLL